jgi:tRNA (adenine37-N6)-methyltransferase
MTQTIQFESIGVIRTPFIHQAGTPIQSVFGDDVEGTVVLDAAYANALCDLDGFDRIWLLTHMDRARPWRPRLVPYRDTVERGLFSTRAPSRPNPLGLSVVRVVRVEPPRITVRGVDMLDGTPLLDIKPYVPEFDAHSEARAGWLDAHSTDRTAADARFIQPDPAAVLLDLSEHCIETAARRKHRRLADCALGGGGEDGGQAMELLDRFLRETDFRRLRAEEPDLAGGFGVRVELRSGRDGRVRWSRIG